MVSTDLFDTVVLRDRTTESERFALAARRAAGRLGVDPAVVARLRWSFHDDAYRAVAAERPAGDAALRDICRAMAIALGRDDDSADVLHAAEVATDIAHLRPNRSLLALYGELARRGMRIVAVSDTYYGEDDLRRILDGVVGAHPFAAVYSSADVGLTKHQGHLFGEVAKRENLSADQILHVGDHPDADVRLARAAGWTAVHLPRNTRHRLRKVAGRVLALDDQLRRIR
jgi:FMN phosphatase YigB (HAD superfamily)